MILNIDNPVYNTIIAFLIIIILLYIIKPDVVYDHNKKEFRQFGTTNGKTLLPIYVISILLAILLYAFFYYLYQRNNNNQKDLFDTSKQNIFPSIDKLDQSQIHIQQQIQLQNIQTQLNNLIQQQITSQLLNKQIKSDRITDSILPNNLNI